MCPAPADEADRRGGVAHREMRDRRQRQHTVRGVLVHRGQQALDGFRMGVRQQRQVDGVQRQVATEREQPEPGVAVDVALADLDEPPAERQQFDARALGGAGQRVEHDVHAVAAGVPLRICSAKSVLRES